MPRTQGIYIITNMVTAETYIGSSVDIAERWSDYRWHLKNSRHKNAAFQAAYDIHGFGAFSLAILELVEQAEHLAPREQHYLDLLKPIYDGDEVAIRAPYRTWCSDEADVKRFWSKVDQPEEGYWLWQGTMLKQGYGCFKIAGKMYKAHRIAYTYAKGAIPRGLILCHSCDNPRCVRPDHLFPGTYKLRRGELNGRARLTREQVEEVCTRYAHGGVSQLALSEEYHVAQTTISAIVRRRNWKD